MPRQNGKPASFKKMFGVLVEFGTVGLIFMPKTVACCSRIFASGAFFPQHVSSADLGVHTTEEERCTYNNITIVCKG